MAFFLVYFAVIFLIQHGYAHFEEATEATQSVVSSPHLRGGFGLCPAIVGLSRAETSPFRRFVFLRRITGAMAQAEPWFCSWCRKDSKASHTNSGFCESYWQDCVQGQEAPKSPRRKRQPSARGRAKFSLRYGSAIPNLLLGNSPSRPRSGARVATSSRACGIFGSIGILKCCPNGSSTIA